jgi:cell wall assembly regulator SMI1
LKVTFKLEPFPTRRWDLPDTPKVAKLWRRLNELFAQWKPKRGSNKPTDGDYRYHSFEADAADPELDRRITQFAKEVEASRAATGNVEVKLTAGEMKRARYVEFGARSLENAEEESPGTRNVYPALCGACGWPDLAKVPSPYWVSPEVRKRPKEDLFSAQEGLLVVRPRALEVLRAAAGGEITFGPACVLGEKLKDVAEEERLWWVRPVHGIGPTTAWYVQKRCGKCKRPVHGHFNPPHDDDEPQFGDWRPRVPSYAGGHGASLVRLEEFAGHVSKDGTIDFFGRLAISGALFEHLKAMKVKGGGLNVSRSSGLCILSARADEPPLDSKPRAFAKPGEAALERVTPNPKPVVKVDPAAVARDVEASWKRIDAWLKKNAPHVYEGLSPGATEAQIAEVERKLKVELPPDVRASWRVHDGGGEESNLLPPSEKDGLAFSPLSLKQMARDYKSQRSWVGWEKGWLPIAANLAGDYQCVDLASDDGDPATRGRVIEFLHELSDYEPLATSLADRLRDLAGGLESGKYRYDEETGVGERGE